MNRKRLLKTCIMICLILSISFFTIKVCADSGFDTSYSSSDSGSYSSSNSYSGSGGSAMSKEEAIIFFIGLGCMLVFLLAITYFYHQKAEKRFKDSIKEMNYDDILKIDSKFNINEFKNMVYTKFVEIQDDWMNFNYDRLRSNLTDELYNQYVMQLDTLKTKNQKNIMSNFKLLQCNINSIKLENGIETIDAILIVTFKDYIVNEKNRVIRGDKNIIYKMTYKLTFIRNINTTENKCPNCGAEVNKNENKCSYCRATIITKNDNWVLSKKQLLRQLHATEYSMKQFFKILLIIMFFVIIGMILLIVCK